MKKLNHSLKKNVCSFSRPPLKKSDEDARHWTILIWQGTWALTTYYSPPDMGDGQK